MCDYCYGWFKCSLNPTPTHFPVTLFELHQKKNPNLKPWWKLEKGQDCQAWSKVQMQRTIKKTSLWRPPPPLKNVVLEPHCAIWHIRDTSETARLIICCLFTPCSSYLNSRVEPEINGESSLFSEMPGRNKKLQIIQFKKEGGKKSHLTSWQTALTCPQKTAGLLDICMRYSAVSPGGHLGFDTASV